MNQQTSTIEECIENCIECHSVCMQTLMHCLQMGGKHAEPNHIRLMLDCAEICQLSANFMERTSDLHSQVCAVCADACRRCADECEQFDDEVMRACADTCWRCSDTCSDMAGISTEGPGAAAASF